MYVYILEDLDMKKKNTFMCIDLYIYTECIAAMCMSLCLLVLNFAPHLYFFMEVCLILLPMISLHICSCSLKMYFYVSLASGVCPSV